MPTSIRENQFLRASDFEGIKEDHSASGLIPNLYCPDCHAQGFKTDKPGVAVCGDYPGWYFLYEEDEENGKKKYMLKLINGEIQEVAVYKTQTITNHP